MRDTSEQLLQTEGVDIALLKEDSHLLSEIGISLHGAEQELRLLTLISWLFVIVYALASHFLLQTSILAAVMIYMWSMYTTWLWHVLAHFEWTGMLHEVHMNHHKKQYLFYFWKNNDIKKKPSVGDQKRSQWESFQRDFCHFGPLRLLYIIGLVIICLLVAHTYFSLLSNILFVYLYEKWSFYIHNAVHCEQHPWQKYGWFQALRAVHIKHHRGTWHQNFTTGENFLFDYMFGTIETVRLGTNNDNKPDKDNEYSKDTAPMTTLRQRKVSASEATNKAEEAEKEEAKEKRHSFFESISHWDQLAAIFVSPSISHHHHH